MKYSNPELEGNRTGGFSSPLLPKRTHTWAMNAAFHAAVPYPYKDYYQRFVQQYFHWYDGFGPNFHQQAYGIFSTRLAYTVLHSLAQKTTGNKVLFDDEGLELTEEREIWGKKYTALAFAEMYAKEFGLHGKATQAVEFAFAGGDSLIKLNQRNGDVVPTVHRKDTYFLDVDFMGEITKVSVLLYDYTAMNRDEDGNQRIFYLLEERKYDDNGRPVERISIKEGQGHMVTYKSVDFQSGSVEFTSLPRDVRKKVAKDFPNVQFNEWEELAFDTLGVYLIKASEKVSFAPSLPFGESLLSNNIAVLMSYDFYYSAMMTDMYNARGKVFIPRNMSKPNDGNAGDHFTGFNEAYVEQIPYTNPDAQKPMIVQFDTRAMDWKEIRNHLLQTLATNIGISERTIATYLVPASEKPTAYEISSDENATANFIESRRPLITRQLDKMFDEILKFYGFRDRIITKFSRIGLSNFNNVVNQVAILKQNGLIDERTALEKIYPDYTQKQIDSIQQRLKEEREQKQNIDAQLKKVKEDTVEAHEDMIRQSNPPKPPQ